MESAPRRAKAPNRLSAIVMHPLAKLAGAIVLVQAVFWLAVYPALFAQARLGDHVIPSSAPEVAQLTAPTLDSLAQADFKPFEPTGEPLMPGYYASRSTFTLDTIPARGIGLVTFDGSDNFRLVINGEPLAYEGSMGVDAPSYYRLRASIEQVPPVFLRQGENVVESIQVIGEPARVANFYPPVIAEYEAFVEATAASLFIRTTWLLITIVAGFILSLFLLVALVRSRERYLTTALFALALSWSLHNLFFYLPDMPIHGKVRVEFYSLSMLAVSASWPFVIDAWSEQSLRWFRWAMWIALGLAAIAVTWLIFGMAGQYGWYHAQDVLDRTGLFFFAATVGRLVWHFIRVRGERRYWEAALLVLTASLLASYLTNLMWTGVNLPYFRLSQPLILLALVIMIFSRNFRLFRSTAQINALLQEQLDEKTAALEAAHEREKGLVRQQAHDEERRRLMRDMHDGLGSHLMALLVMARRGIGKSEDYAEGIQQVIDEMRLMIESLDSVGDSLEIALESFRKMMSARIGTAGFTLDWRDEMHGTSMPDYDARTILQVFRIMQEAVSNALKHSGGDTIAITTSASGSSDHALEICIRDNGNGQALPPDRPGGHGLRNMRARAASIGAQLEISGGESGTNVTLCLPQDSTAEVGAS